MKKLPVVKEEAKEAIEPAPIKSAEEELLYRILGDTEAPERYAQPITSITTSVTGSGSVTPATWTLLPPEVKVIRKPLRFKEEPSDEEEHDDGEEDISEEERADRSYNCFDRRVSRTCEVYKRTGDTMHIIRLMLGNFTRYLNSALSYSINRHTEIDYLPKLTRDFKGFKEELDCIGIPLDEKACDEVHSFMEAIFRDTPPGRMKKMLYINLPSFSMCSELVQRSIRKGVKVDPLLLETMRDTNFDDLLLNGHIIETCYVHGINTLVLVNATGEDSGMFSQTGQYYKALVLMEDVHTESTLEDDDIIEIDGRKFSRKIFESITESSYNNFIANLEIETILSKDIAEENVADGEFKLL